MAKKITSKKKTVAKKVNSKKSATTKKKLARPTSELAKYLKKVKDAKQAHKSAESNTNAAIRKVAQAERALKKTAASAANKKSKVTVTDKKRAAAAVQKAKNNVVTLKGKTKIALEKLKDVEFELNLMEKKGSAMEKAVAAFSRKWEREFNASMREKIAARKAKKSNQKTKKKAVPIKAIEEKVAPEPKPEPKSDPIPESQRNNDSIVIATPDITMESPESTSMSDLDAAIAAELSLDDDLNPLGGNDDFSAGDYSEDDNNDDYY